MLFRSLFANSPANGEWRLYVFDDQSPNAGSILRGWSLTIVGSQVLSTSQAALQIALSIVQEGDAVQLAWPTSAPGHVLQSADESTNPVWQDVQTLPSVESGQFRVTIDPAETAKIYRLRAQ